MSNKRRPFLPFTLAVALTCACSCSEKKNDESVYTGDLFNQNIRTTEPRTADEEMAGFKVPPGFEIQLFASEPNIDKPINMAFDAQGRLWVTQSFEYPFPTAPGKKSTDKITILEDTDHDGKADTFTPVADSLDIPIGVLPLVDGALAFSIPNLYQYADANRDGKMESSRILFGPFGFTDTHGMVSNFTRGYDGWVYACHGFTNLSVVAGTDGDSMKLVSGNTFRFKLDGSRVEQMTFGQVNPFGLAYDENGYIYSTDSHSSPLYQLIRGADYPHFSKPEIMAFGPDMKSFENEATALAGIAYYGDTKFPTEFQGNFFVGDPFLSRVHRYSWINRGSTPIGKSEVDFIQSADPWFRPVNVKLGPDGALYVADFYNAIIGHYEVPLGHPKRDKQRGRIWRITYKGEQNNVQDLSTASTDELIAALDVANIITRMAAADQLADRIGAAATAPLKRQLANPNLSPRQSVHVLWTLYRLQAMDDDILSKAMSNTSPLVRLHALRILREYKPGAETFNAPVVAALQDPDPHVQRMAVELLVHYPQMSSVENVLAVLNGSPQTDTHLVYTSRLCLRNLLRRDNLMKQVRQKTWRDADAGFIAGTLVDVSSLDAALFLTSYLKQHDMPKAKIQLAYQQVMRYLPENQIAPAIQAAREKVPVDAASEAMAFRGINDGLDQRGFKAKPKSLVVWGAAIAAGIFKQYPAGFTPTNEEIENLQGYAIQLAADGNAKTLEPALTSFLESRSTSLDVKSAALRAKLKLASDQSGIELAASILNQDSTPIDFKKRIVALLGEYPGSETNKVLVALKKSPADLEVVIATALASSREGKDLVFKQVRSGAFMTRTLIDPRVAERLLLQVSPQQQKEYDALTASIEPVSAERQTLIDERLKLFKSYRPTTAQLDSGAMVFGSNCGVCHRRLVQSGIGPQLHGIGKRGADAIAEKILDPNRNISEAFRNYTITLKDGRVLTGLFRADQGAVTVFGDLNGKEFSIAKSDMVEMKPSRYTIMPDHFGTTLSQQQFNALLTYLLTW